MIISREQVIDRLSEKSGYWKKDIRELLKCLDEVVLDCFGEVSDDEEIIVQLVKGLRCGCKIVKPRERVDPRNGNPIVVKSTVKPFCKFSDDFREQIQSNYEEKREV